jgi:hypothetical protein
LGPTERHPPDSLLVNTAWEAEAQPLPFGIPLDGKLRQVAAELGDAFANDAEASAQRSLNNQYHTGDLAYKDE